MLSARAMYFSARRVSVGIPGLVRFGECRFPMGCGQFEAVAAQVGKLDVYTFPAGGIGCFR